MTIRHWTAALVFSAALLGAGCEGGLFHRKECCPTAGTPPCGCKTTAAAPPCGCNTATAGLPAGAIPVQPGTTPAFGQ